MGSISSAVESVGKNETMQKSHDANFDDNVLCGFVEVVLVLRGSKDNKEDSDGNILLERNCCLRIDENETYAVVEDSDSVLMQMKKGSDDGGQNQMIDNTLRSQDNLPGLYEVAHVPSFCTEETDGRGSPCPPNSEAEQNNINSGNVDAGRCSKRRGSGLRFPVQKHYHDGILDQLHDLEKKNKVKVAGKVMYRHYTGHQEYFVVLFDVYFASTARRVWKGGTSIGACLSHLSSDWERRRRVLDHQLSYSLDVISKTGNCHVVGCSTHPELSDAEKSSRFDLNSMFRTLNSIKHDTLSTTTLKPGMRQVGACKTGIWELPNEVFLMMFVKLLPRDLHSVSLVARHFQNLASSIMPGLNLKLYPHQERAVQWMMEREQTPKPLAHPHFGHLVSEGGEELYFDKVTGERLLEGPPSSCDFRGGLVCDEPGLGKTVTALSLILKTRGILSRPPPDVDVQWCEHTSRQKRGYYEVSSKYVSHGSMSALKRCSLLKAKQYQIDSPIKSPSSFSHTPSSSSPSYKLQPVPGSRKSLRRGFHSPPSPAVMSVSPVESLTSVASESTSTSTRAKRKLWDSTPEKSSNKTARQSSSTARGKKGGKYDDSLDAEEEDSIWAQCDACGKWRKIPKGGQPLKEGSAWFCSMNKDKLFQDCTVPEERFDDELIKSLPGFVHASKETDLQTNVTFFTSVLSSQAHHIDEEAKQALRWIAHLPREKVLKTAVEGIQLPQTLQLNSGDSHNCHPYDKVFQAFGLVKKKEHKKSTKWFYPKNLDNLLFDSLALRYSLAEPVDDVMRFYLSTATLVVVPNNLVDHWQSQIVRHTSEGQLTYFIWNDVRKLPPAHILAWEFDVVITTFSRLSAEWNSRDTSPLSKIHWLRIVLDEGHTLGASVAVTNKLLMAVSMRACRRWILTGTPTPNTPASQVSHLQPLFKFLHEETYGKNPKVFDAAILRPFEAGMEDGRQLLWNLLQRCMISARKCDLNMIPACIRSVKLLDFTSRTHAASYNELVVTVRRNILMADWKDPNHVESLLNPKQWKFRRSTLRNVRLSCCVAGHIKMFNAKGDLHETMDILVSQGLDRTSEEFENIRNSLLVGGSCQRCFEYCRLPIITPCRHLLCLACVSLDGTKCTKCGHGYQMQSHEDRARPENPNPKWPVPQDLIELQPSYVQDNWSQEWHSTCSSKIAYLLRQLQAMNCRNENTSQFAYIMGDTENTAGVVRRAENSIAAPEKAIVFSQFLEHINVIEKQCKAAGVNCVGMYSPMPLKDKMRSLAKFSSEPDCTVLVMDATVAVGLDLSFVTNVYLMEPIWDRSMEEQVVSRAHRMGATRPVIVETLAMRGTIEEQMLESLNVPRGSRGLDQDPAETYLEELDFVHWKE